MCHYVNEIQSLVKYFKGKFIAEIFQGLRAVPGMSYGEVKAGHCLGCKRSLSYQEMFPPGRCPRSLCQNCYSSVISSVPNYRCIITGSPLSQEQVNNQYVNQRELRNYIANDFPSAWDLFLVLSNKVLGTDMSFLRDEQALQYRQLQDVTPNDGFVPISSYKLNRPGMLDYSVNTLQRTFKGKNVVCLN